MTSCKEIIIEIFLIKLVELCAINSSSGVFLILIYYATIGLHLLIVQCTFVFVHYSLDLEIFPGDYALKIPIC